LFGKGHTGAGSIVTEKKGALVRTIEQLAPYRVSLWGSVRMLNERDYCSAHNLGMMLFAALSKLSS
jgi:hypothetical protein